MVNSLAYLWFTREISHVIPITLCWVVCLLLGWVLRNRSPLLAYWLVLLGLFRVFLPVRMPWLPIPSIEPVMPIVQTVLPPVVVKSSPVQGLSYIGLLFILWVCMIAILIGYRVWMQISFQRFRRTLKEVDHDDLEPLALRYGIQRIPRLYAHPGVCSPFTFGVLRPAIVVNEKCIVDGSLDVKTIFAHELGHIYRKDSLFQECEFWISVFNFMNPVVYLVIHFLRRQREIVADRTALYMMGESPVQYSRHLIRNVEYSLKLTPAIPLHFRKNFLKERILHLVNLKEITMPRMTLGHKILLVIVFSIMFVFSAYSSPTSGKAVQLPVDTQMNQQGASLIQVEKTHELVCQNGKAEPAELKMAEVQSVKAKEKTRDDFRVVPAPVILTKQQPVYPATFRAQGWEATVMVRVSILADGSVERADVTSLKMMRNDRKKKVVKVDVSQAHKNEFAQAALEAVKQWRFQTEQPIEVMIPVRFVLGDSK